MSWWQDIHTGVDGKTFDHGRVWASLFGASGLGMQMWDFFARGAKFDMQAFGVGIAAFAAGIGALLKLKENSEPKP